MTLPERYDILVLGGGKAGKTLAMDQARAGKRVAMVEAGMIGGSCINVACIPSKALIRSAEVAHTVGHSAAFGTAVRGARVEMARVAARTAAVVSGMVDANRAQFEASGLELVLGWGRFVEPGVVEVASEGGGRRLTGGRIYLDLGTEAAIPAIPGLAEAVPLTHVSALSLDVLPKRLLVLGGGYVGLEMAQAFSRLGSEVILVEQGPQLATREDPDVARAIQGVLEEDGVEVALGAALVAVEGRSGARVAVSFGNGRHLEGSHLLVAAGRRPRTGGIGLDIAGVALDTRGYIKVDERLRTTAEGVWALGEAAGSPMFTHVSLDDYRVAKAGITGAERTTSGRLIPYCVFVDPEFARVGLGEAEARRAGVRYRLARLPLDAVPRARTADERKGFMKCLVAAEADNILGFAMLGARAGEVMTTVQVAMLGGLGYTALRDGILAHPTFAEGLNLLFANLRPPAPADSTMEFGRASAA